MFDVVESDTFTRWVDGLRDRRAVARIQARLRNITMGNFGGVRPLGDGVSEMRIHYGPGYRLYFMRQALMLLFCSVAATKTANSATLLAPNESPCNGAKP